MVMTTEAAKQESSYLEAFRTRQSETAGVGPTWVARLREGAMQRFEEIGFPSVKEEEWKYTNVAPISKLRFETNQSVSDSK